MNIIIPDGYLVDEIPQAKLMVLPKNKGKFSYTVTQTGNRLTVVSNIQINESVFIQDEYPGLENFIIELLPSRLSKLYSKKKG